MTETLRHKAHASQPHTLPSRSKPMLNPKLVKECVCPNARTEKEKARAHNNGYT